jgi:hypothetical protein
LDVDGKHFAYTVEDAVRDVKIPGETAIPKGTYNLRITYSNRFKRNMIQVMNVPNFEGIRIHGGNTAKDTEGCIIIGQTQTATGVSNCSKVLQDLENLVKTELEDMHQVSLTIL